MPVLVAAHTQCGCIFDAGIWYFHTMRMRLRNLRQLPARRTGAICIMNVILFASGSTMVLSMVLPWLW